jgi:spore germination cell wall hydrolase CwlJ-like protein
LIIALRSRAATRALVLLVGTVLGVAFGATCLADGSDPRPATAQAYVRALRSGYAATTPGGAPTHAVPAAKPRHTPTLGVVERSRALDCLAAAVYYEARGEDASGRAAVAQVVLNRTRHGQYPGSVCAVVYQGARQGECQFSFVCNGAMKGQRERLAWADARRIAARALRGYVMAAVGRATCFHALGARQAAEGGVRVGRQVFYANS